MKKRLLIFLALTILVLAAVILGRTKVFINRGSETIANEEKRTSSGDSRQNNEGRELTTNIRSAKGPNAENTELRDSEYSSFPLELLTYPVSYDAIGAHGKEILPKLYNILSDSRKQDYWYGAVRAIGHLGRQPGSAQVVRRFLLQDVEFDGGAPFCQTEEYSQKLAAIHVLGLTSRTDDKRFLRGLLSERAKVEELCFGWSPGIAASESDFLALSAEMRAAACRALIFTQSPDNIEYAKSFVESLKLEASHSGLYEKHDANLTWDKRYMKVLLIKLDDAMTRCALINDIGMAQYLRIETNPQAFASAILPYVFEERGIPLANAQITVN